VVRAALDLPKGSRLQVWCRCARCPGHVQGFAIGVGVGHEPRQVSVEHVLMMMMMMMMMFLRYEIQVKLGSILA
jgi:hypothetical protein